MRDGIDNLLVHSITVLFWDIAAVQEILRVGHIPNAVVITAAGAVPQLRRGFSAWLELQWPSPLAIPENFEALLQQLIPEEFKCPISLAIMSQPVVWNGHTYDRASLQGMVAAQNRARVRDPVQGVNVSLVLDADGRYDFAQGTVQPNLAVRSLIEAFVAQQPAARSRPAPRGRGQIKAPVRRRTATPST